MKKTAHHRNEPPSLLARFAHAARLAAEGAIHIGSAPEKIRQDAVTNALTVLGEGTVIVTEADPLIAAPLIAAEAWTEALDPEKRENLPADVAISIFSSPLAAVQALKGLVSDFEAAGELFDKVQHHPQARRAHPATHAQPA